MKNPFFTQVDEVLFQSRVIQVSGVVNSELAYRVNRELLALEKLDPAKPIVMYVDSPGGEINSGFSVFDTVRFIQPTVYTVVAGLAASMGSIIALSAQKENRYALPNAKFLIHQPLVSGTIYGQATDVAIHARDIVKTRERINQLYAAETGKSVKEIAEATERDNWMTPEEAKAFGLISRILKSRADLKV